jgi:hypothetical protein
LSRSVGTGIAVDGAKVTREEEEEEDSTIVLDVRLRPCDRVFVVVAVTVSANNSVPRRTV